MVAEGQEVSINRPDTGSLLRGLRVQIILIGLIVVTWRLLPHQDLLSFASLICVVILGTQLYNDIKERTTPAIKKYGVALLIGLCISTGWWYLAAWLGLYGWLGITALVLLLAGWRVWQGRKLFLQTAKWIGTQMRGKDK